MTALSPASESDESPAPGSRRPRPRLVLFLLAGLCLLHAWQSVRLFPSVAALLDRGQPVLSVDHALHQYHGALGAGFLTRHGTPWGIDPAFMAGYPETPLWDSSSNLSLLFQLPAAGKLDFRAYKLGLLACGVVLVPLLALGGWALGMPVGGVLISSVLAWLYLWVGFPSSLWMSGLFSFVTGSVLTLLLLSLLVRFDAEPSRRLWLAVALVGVVAFWSHVTAPIVAVGGLAGYLLASCRRHRLGWLLALVGSSLVVAGVNLVWLVPLWRFRGIRTGSGFFLTAASIWELPRYLVTQPLDGRLSLIVLLLGAWGVLRLFAVGRRVEASTLCGAGLALFLLAAAGSVWSPTRMLEPLRFRVPLVLLLCWPAGGFLHAIGRWARERSGGGKRGVVVVAGLVLLSLTAIGFLMPLTARLTAAYLTQRRSLVVGYRAPMRAFVRSIEDLTDSSGRIMLEDQLRLFEATDPESTHWTPLLPDMLGADQRQFIGGLYHAAFIEHHEATSFGDFHLAGRMLTDWGIADLQAYLDRYNAGWVVAWSPVTRYVFDRFPGATRIGQVPRFVTPGLIVPAAERQWQAIAERSGAELANRYILEGGQSYAVYRLDRQRSYFLEGEGTLESTAPNRVVFRDVRPGADGKAVISLHWMESWDSIPRCPLERAEIPGDRVGFVRIELPGPVPRLVLRNSYRASTARPAELDREK